MGRTAVLRATAQDGFLVPPMQHGSWVLAATFDAKGERVLTASDDKTAQVWETLPASDQALLDRILLTLGANAPKLLNSR